MTGVAVAQKNASNLYNSALGSDDAIHASMRQRIDTLALDLSDLTVVTEAATGAYACSAVIAAMAGARRVYALGRDTQNYGSKQQAQNETYALAVKAGVSDRIVFVDELGSAELERCDIITNSGHLRPITSEVIEKLPPRSVIALMFEAWEFRGADLDLVACRDHGIRVAAVNECHPNTAVFPFLGPLCVRLIESVGTTIASLKIALICDNPFLPFIASGLRNAGATVATYRKLSDFRSLDWQVVVIALDPNHNLPVNSAALTILKQKAPNAFVAQFWGDIDREAAKAQEINVVPEVGPRSGHMGILLNALGFEPIVRLQTGGLRAAEIIFRNQAMPVGGIAHLL